MRGQYPDDSVAGNSHPWLEVEVVGSKGVAHRLYRKPRTLGHMSGLLFITGLVQTGLLGEGNRVRGVAAFQASCARAR